GGGVVENLRHEQLPEPGAPLGRDAGKVEPRTSFWKSRRLGILHSQQAQVDLGAVCPPRDYDQPSTLLGGRAFINAALDGPRNNGPDSRVRIDEGADVRHSPTEVWALNEASGLALRAE